MLYPSMNNLLENINNRYLLVNVVARRARQIAYEAEQDAIMLNKKPVSLAIEEISEGKLTASIKNPQDGSDDSQASFG